VKLEFDSVRGDVLNVVPPHAPATSPVKAGLITHNNRWCDVDWRTLESKAVKGVHVLGDSTLSPPPCRNPGTWPISTRRCARTPWLRSSMAASPIPTR